MRGEKFITFRCFGAEYYCIIFFIAFMSIILCINLMFLPIHFLFHDTSKQPAQQKRDEEVSEAGTIERKRTSLGIWMHNRNFSMCAISFGR